MGWLIVNISSVKIWKCLNVHVRGEDCNCQKLENPWSSGRGRRALEMIRVASCVANVLPCNVSGNASNYQAAGMSHVAPPLGSHGMHCVACGPRGGAMWHMHVDYVIWLDHKSSHDQLVVHDRSMWCCLSCIGVNLNYKPKFKPRWHSYDGHRSLFIWLS